MAIYGVVAPERRIELDADQASALRSFILDLDDVLAEALVAPGYSERLCRGLAAAYYAALVTRKWHFFIALLSSALDDLEDAGDRPRARAAGQYWRLRAMVRENADLLSPEMLRIS